MTSLQSTRNTEDLHTRFADTLAAHWKGFLIQGVVIVILGLLAAALPMISTLAIEILIGWLFLIGGVLRVASLFRTRHTPGYWWSLISAIMSIILGLVLVAAPLQGVMTLTLVLTVLFLVEGVSAIPAALDFRKHSQSWGWLLLSGIVDFMLVFLIWEGWPGTAAWAIGLMTGVNLVFLGVSLIMLALVARRRSSQVADEMSG